jgi:DNA end-binding protein Ku
VPHAIWKGAISFGLVHIPVALYPGSSEIGIDFDWLDKRSMDPVGYQRINKKTGKEIAKENIVKGVKVQGDDYVVISDDEIKAAYPKTTQTIEIESFVHAADIPFTRLEKPYYIEPISKGEKVYALLREAMSEAGVVGIARVVMHTKEYLAALISTGPALILNTLRWSEEIRPWTEVKLPAAGKGSLKPAELAMAKQLIGDMTETWKPDAYTDKFTTAIHALVAQRAKAGATQTVQPMEESADASAGNVVDLTALLKQSLTRKGGSRKSETPEKSTGEKSTGEKSTERADAAKSSVPRRAARKRA